MSLPDYFIIKDVSLASEDNVLSSDSQSLKRLVRDRTGQRWRITMDLMLLPEDAMAGFAWLNKRKAQAFTLAIPGWTGKGPTSTQVAVTAQAGVTEMQVSNPVGIQVGQLFQAPGSSKVYQVTEVTGSTIDFTPELVAPAVSGLALGFSGAQFTVFIDTPIPEIRQESLRMPSLISMQFVEAVP